MKSFQQFVTDTCASINEIDVDTLAQKLQLAHLLIDIREPNEWQQGIIAGAYCCPRGILESKIEMLLDRQKSNAEHPLPVFLYCRSGARSALAAHSLQAMGVTGCFSLRGGFQAWQQAGMSCTAVTPEHVC